AANARYRAPAGADYPLYVTDRPPEPPDGLTLRPGPDTVALTWGEVLGAGGYRGLGRRPGGTGDRGGLAGAAVACVGRGGDGGGAGRGAPGRGPGGGPPGGAGGGGFPVLGGRGGGGDRQGGGSAGRAGPARPAGGGAWAPADPARLPPAAQLPRAAVLARA